MWRCPRTPARGREHLCRYLLRPPLARERLTESSGGQLLYELAHPRADGATHLLLDPLELIEKLCVLVPAPRTHLLRYHGVLAPHAAWPSLVVPRPRQPVAPRPSLGWTSRRLGRAPRQRRPAAPRVRRRRGPGDRICLTRPASPRPVPRRSPSSARLRRARTGSRPRGQVLDHRTNRLPSRRLTWPPPSAIPAL